MGEREKKRGFITNIPMQPSLPKEKDGIHVERIGTKKAALKGDEKERKKMGNTGTPDKPLEGGPNLPILQPPPPNLWESLKSNPHPKRHSAQHEHQQRPGPGRRDRDPSGSVMMAEVDAEGKALDAERDVLLDGCVDALAGGDVEVGEIVLGRGGGV